MRLTLFFYSLACASLASSAAIQPIRRNSAPLATNLPLRPRDGATGAAGAIGAGGIGAGYGSIPFYTPPTDQGVVPGGSSSGSGVPSNTNTNTTSNTTTTSSTASATPLPEASMHPGTPHPIMPKGYSNGESSVLHDPMQTEHTQQPSWVHINTRDLQHAETKIIGVAVKARRELAALEKRTDEKFAYSYGPYQQPAAKRDGLKGADGARGANGAGYEAPGIATPPAPTGETVPLGNGFYVETWKA
ncbi:MAG: hypothetical protein M1824_002363 [Vezdaea acicularis]|nr:MAG: hypothetical protein M1824_002363 [Vezdaea acicularis]